MIGVEISHTYFVINFKWFVLAQSNELISKFVEEIMEFLL